MDGDDQEVRVYGFGVRVADEIPTGAGGFGKIIEDLGHKNPCILLDNGKKVYGCECWWGPEEEIRSIITGRKIVVVDVEKARTE